MVAIAWVLSRGADVVLLAGAHRRDRLAEALGALDTTLTPDDLARIEQAVPPGSAAGDRYPVSGMASLDSERHDAATGCKERRMALPAALERLLGAERGQATRRVAIIDTQGRVAVHTGSSCVAGARYATGVDGCARAQDLGEGAGRGERGNVKREAGKVRSCTRPGKGESEAGT